MTDRPQIYLTKEQLHRLSGIACDVLVGIQMESTTDSESIVTGTYVPIDHPNDLEFFTVEADGAYHRTT